MASMESNVDDLPAEQPPHQMHTQQHSQVERGAGSRKSSGRSGNRFWSAVTDALSPRQEPTTLQEPERAAEHRRPFWRWQQPHQHEGDDDDAHQQQPPLEYESKEERYRCERNEYRDRLTQCQDQLDRYEQEVAQLRKLLVETKQSSARINQRNNEKDLFVGPQASEPKIIEQFGELLTRLRSWSSQFIGDEAVQASKLTEGREKDFAIIVPDCNEANLNRILRVKTTRRYLAEAWVSLVLTQTFFRCCPEEGYPGVSGSDLWAGRRGSKLIAAGERRFSSCGNNGISLREANDWRAFSAYLLSKTDLSGEEKSAVDNVVMEKCRRDLLDVILPLCKGPDLGSLERVPSTGYNQALTELNSNHTRDITSGLLAMAQAAMELSKLLRLQRVNWTLRFPSNISQPSQQGDISMDDENVHGGTVGKANGTNTQSGFTASHSFNRLPFDPFTMKPLQPIEDDEEQPDLTVDIIVTPALFKRGNTDGDLFDQLTCVVHSKVSCI